MPLCHILNGIYSTEENPMDVINGTFQKGEKKRKKQVQNVQTEELQTQKGKEILKSTEVPKKVTFKKIYFPTDLYQQIIVDEDATSAGKSKKHSLKKNIDEGSFIPNQQVVHLNTLDSRCKRRRQVVESNISTKS